MPDDTLILLLDEVRSKTLRFLDGVPEVEARWAPTGLQNTILWHAGHCYILAEWMTVAATDQTPRCPDGWFEMFGWMSQPVKVPLARWPALDEVVLRLGDQHDRLKELIGRLSPEELTRGSASNPDCTVRNSIVHGLHDEACHCGEILLLRKLRGLGRPARNAL